MSEAFMTTVASLFVAEENRTRIEPVEVDMAEIESRMLARFEDHNDEEELNFD